MIVGERDVCGGMFVARVDDDGSWIVCDSCGFGMRQYPPRDRSKKNDNSKGTTTMRTTTEVLTVAYVRSHWNVFGDADRAALAAADVIGVDVEVTLMHSIVGRVIAKIVPLISVEKAAATKAYDACAATIDGLLATIRRSLDAHRAHQQQHPSDWGFAGDLENVSRKLSEVAAFIACHDLDGRIASHDEIAPHASIARMRADKKHGAS